MGGFLSTALGLRLLRVTGRGKAGAIVSAIQITGLLLAEIWALLTAAGYGTDHAGLYTITDLAWPFSHVFMLAVAFAVWRAKLWLGWPVLMLFLWGCALPLAMVARPIFGDLGTISIFGILTSVSLLATARNLRVLHSGKPTFEHLRPAEETV